MQLGAKPEDRILELRIGSQQLQELVMAVVGEQLVGLCKERDKPSLDVVRIDSIVISAKGNSRNLKKSLALGKAQVGVPSNLQLVGDEVDELG